MAEALPPELQALLGKAGPAVEKWALKHPMKALKLHRELKKLPVGEIEAKVKEIVGNADIPTEEISKLSSLLASEK